MKTTITMISLINSSFQTQKHFGPTYPVDCTCCQKSSDWNLTRVRTWTTLFQVPVMPVETNYVLHCGNCGDHFEVDWPKFQKALKLHEFITNLIEQTDSDAIDHTNLGKVRA